MKALQIITEAIGGLILFAIIYATVIAIWALTAPMPEYQTGSPAELRAMIQSCDRAHIKDGSVRCE